MPLQDGRLPFEKAVRARRLSVHQAPPAWVVSLLAVVNFGQRNRRKAAEGQGRSRVYAT